MAFWTEIVIGWEKVRAFAFLALGLAALMVYTWLAYAGAEDDFCAREVTRCAEQRAQPVEPLEPDRGDIWHSDTCARNDLTNGKCTSERAVLELENRRCAERVEPRVHALTAVRIRNSCLVQGLSLDHTVVSGDVQIENSELRNGIDQAAALSLRGAEATAVTMNHGSRVERLEVATTTIRGVLDLEDASFRTVEIAGAKIGEIEAGRVVVTGPARRGDEPSFILRNLEVGQIGLNDASLHSVDLTTVTVQGGVALSSSRWDKAQLNNLKSTQLDMANVRGVTALEPRLEAHNVEVVQFDLARARLGEVTLSNVHARSELSLEGARWRTLVIDHLRVGELDMANGSGPSGEASVHLMQVQADGIDMSGCRLSTLELESVTVGGGISLQGAGWSKATFGGANMRELSLEYAQGGLVELADSRIVRMDVTGFEARGGGYGRWHGGALADLGHERGSAGLLCILHSQQRDDAIQGFRTLESNLRERGQRAEANRVHVEGLSHRESWDQVRWLYQDGLGSPFAYALLLLSLTWFGACFFSVQKVHAVDAPAPGRVTAQTEMDGAAPQVAAEKATSPGERIAGYSPFIMSLATLLPGDSLNYLRNFKFVPKADGHAWVMVLLQVLALLVQALIVYSVSSLLAR